jgi:hypothetical protein
LTGVRGYIARSRYGVLYPFLSTLANDVFGDRVFLDGVAVARAVYERAKNSWVSRAALNLEHEARTWSSTYNGLFPPRPAAGFAIPVLDQLTPERFEEWAARILQHLDELAAKLKLPPARMVIWFEPSSHEVVEIWTAPTQGRPVHPYIEKTRAGWQIIRERLEARGYRVIETRRAMDDLLLKEGRYPYSASGHYRPEAYTIAADAIEPVLREVLNAPVTVQ